MQAFHHPAIRNDNITIQRDMFRTVQQWANEHPRRHELEQVLSSESVRLGKNQIVHDGQGGHGGHSHGALQNLSQLGHGKVAGSLWNQVRTRDMDALEGRDGDPATGYVSASPAPAPNFPGGEPSYQYGENPQYQSEGGFLQPGPPGPPGGYSYSAPSPQPYYQNYQNYNAPPPPPPAGYGGPGYAPGPGYGPPPPQYPPYGQPPPPQQPGDWRQYQGYR